MLHVTMENKYNNGITNHAAWHIGEQITWNHSEVIEIQADGDELHRISIQIATNNVLNIPIRKDKPVVTWYGDDAKFISRNIL